MDLSQIDMLAAFAAAAGVWMCGLMNLRAILWGLTIQTTLLGLIALILGRQTHAEHFLIMAGVVIVVKALLIPFFLGWIAKRIDVRRDKGTGLHGLWYFLSDVEHWQ
jgi:hydrogenase-4 membrane subunit HyfE